MNKKIFVTLLGIVLAGGIIFTGFRFVFAAHPNSGTTSRLQTIYTSLSNLGHGADSAGSWGDWGSYWNRLRSAAEFTPSGDATTTDVKNGITFTGNSRTGATGTYPNPTSCATEVYGDNHPSATPTSSCSLTWITASPAITGDDMQDPRTGLVWSQPLKNESGSVAFAKNGYSAWTWNGAINFTVTAATASVGAVYTNNGHNFTVVAASSASTSLYTTADGSPTASGTLTKFSGTGDATITFSSPNAGTNNVAVGGKTASQLCSERGNGWRLPTQNDLMQAWVDGAYFNLVASATNNWSSTSSSATAVFYTTLSSGATSTTTPQSDNYVRCVR